MNEPSRNQQVSYIAIFIFITSLIIFTILSLSGFAWIIVDIDEFSFWLTFVTFLLAISAGGVGTYSFVSFVQTRNTRNLMLIVVGFDMILWAFLFLATHPASIGWAVDFSDRNRNRTLGMVFVLIIVPAILIDSFTGKRVATYKIKYSIVVWGCAVIPAISLWFFFSPEPVFMMTSPDGGLEGLTLEGLVISMGYMLAQLIAVLRSAQKWWSTRTIEDLSLFLALTHWIAGTFFIVILWNPFQIAELLWLGTIVSGFLLIAAVLFITSILNPHELLEELVRQRSYELEVSNKESEFYLNMWTHKMGNLLQGIVTYLDLLDNTPKETPSHLESRGIARSLSKEAMLVNNQVNQLTAIKEMYHVELGQVNLREALMDSIEKAREILSEDVFVAEVDFQNDVFVEADSLLQLMFLSIIIFQSQNRDRKEVSLKFSLEENEESATISIRTPGSPFPSSFMEYLQGSEIIGNLSLNLDIFTIKLLMERYDTKFSCDYDKADSMNISRYKFKKS